MIKKVMIISILFMLSCIFVTNTNNECERTGYHLCEAFEVRGEVNIVFNDNLGYKERPIRIVESKALENRVEIYTPNLYNNHSPQVTFNNNEIIINNAIAPGSIYSAMTFITYAQFDNNYFNDIPREVYTIHIPEGMTYSIK